MFGLVNKKQMTEVNKTIADLRTEVGELRSGLDIILRELGIKEPKKQTTSAKQTTTPSRVYRLKIGYNIVGERGSKSFTADCIPESEEEAKEWALKVSRSFIKDYKKNNPGARLSNRYFSLCKINKNGRIIRGTSLRLNPYKGEFTVLSKGNKGW